MMTLSRLSYASRSIADHHTLRTHLSELIAQSKRNNAKQHLVGVLCYSNGFFFQCIEGPSLAVDTLYHTLLKDPRHHDVRLLEHIDIQQPYFQHWSMKYITLDPATQDFLKHHRLFPFQPYQLTEHHLQLFLLHLSQKNDHSTTLDTLPPHLHGLTHPSMAAIGHVQPRPPQVWFTVACMSALLAAAVVLLSLCLKY